MWSFEKIFKIMNCSVNLASHEMLGERIVCCKNEVDVDEFLADSEPIGVEELEDVFWRQHRVHWNLFDHFPTDKIANENNHYFHRFHHYYQHLLNRILMMMIMKNNMKMSRQKQE